MKITKHIESSYAGQYFCNQVLRSGGSPALHYGEAVGAESNRDFIHKLSVATKELRERHNNLRIIQKSDLCVNKALLESLITECNELISILYATIKTTNRNQKTV